MGIPENPAPAAAPAAPSRLAPAAALVLLGILLHVPFLGLTELESDDEARYAQVAQEMVGNGHWVVPYFNGERYEEKPPAFFWAAAAASLPFGGVGERSARLPSALAGIVLALAVLFLGARLFDVRTGFLAGLLFLLFPQVHEYATRCRLDLLFAAWICLSILVAHGRASEGGRRLLSGLALGACLAGAVLAKGPLGLVIPLAVVAIALALEGRARRIPAALLSPWALLPLAGLVGGWLALAAADPTGGSEYVGRMIRGVEPPEHLKTSFLDTLAFYPKSVLGGTAPWCLFLPAALAWAFARRGGASWRAFALPLTWASFCLLLFSSWPQKRNAYILPVYPAFALLLAPVLREAFRAGRERLAGAAGLLSEIPIWVVAPFAILAAALWALWVPRRWPSAGGLDLLLLPAILLLAGLLILCYAHRRRALVLPVLAAGVAVAFLAIDGRLDPGESAALSFRPVLREIARAVPGDAPLIAWNCLDNRMPLFLRRRVVAVKDFRTGKEGWKSLSDRPEFARAYLLIHRRRALLYGGELSGRRCVGGYLVPEQEKRGAFPRGRRAAASRNPEPAGPPESRRDAILILAPPAPPP